MKIRCVITDDEPMARKGLQGYVDKIDFLELMGVCNLYWVGAGCYCTG